ncbi:hypothetical protein TNCV_96721 [Trichonephila clavipes]|nr:hypothetical protein TNCV_96721 [Trichonephila clavipes]
MIQVLIALEHNIYDDNMLLNSPEESHSVPEVWISMSKMFKSDSGSELPTKISDESITDDKEVPINEIDWKPPTIMSVVDAERSNELPPKTSQASVTDNKEMPSQEIDWKPPTITSLIDADRSSIKSSDSSASLDHENESQSNKAYSKTLTIKGFDEGILRLQQKKKYNEETKDKVVYKYPTLCHPAEGSFATKSVGFCYVGRVKVNSIFSPVDDSTRITYILTHYGKEHVHILMVSTIDVFDSAISSLSCWFPAKHQTGCRV